MTFRRLMLLAAAAVLIAVSLPAAAQETTECEEGFWLFEHERLATDPVCIPEDPQRIISLDMPATEDLLLNDIPIVGVFVYATDEISAITPGLADDLAGIPTFDWPPSLELATELNPDLIIAFKDSSLFYEGMEQIAPMVVYDAAYATDWKSVISNIPARIASRDASGNSSSARRISASKPSRSDHGSWPRRRRTNCCAVVTRRILAPVRRPNRSPRRKARMLSSTYMPSCSIAA